MSYFDLEVVFNESRAGVFTDLFLDFDLDSILQVSPHPSSQVP